VSLSLYKRNQKHIKQASRDWNDAYYWPDSFGKTRDHRSDRELAQVLPAAK